MNAAQLGSTLSDSLKRHATDRRRQPRAVHPRPPQAQCARIVELVAWPERDRRHRVDAAGERPGHRARSGDAGDRRHLDRARQRQRRSRNRGSRAAACMVPPDRPSYTLAARVAHARRRAGLLLRLREQRALAALSHRLRASRIRRCRLAAVREGEPPLRRCGDRRGGRRSRRRLRAGLSLCAAAALREGGAAGRDRLPVLAHSVAQPRGVSRLPVGRGHPARTARQRSARLSRAVSLQQLPRHRRSRARVARRLRALRGLARRPADVRAAVSDQHRSVAVEGPDEGRRPRDGDQERAQDAGPERRAHHLRRRSPRLHEGHSRSPQGLRAAARSLSRVARPRHDGAGRRAEPRAPAALPGADERSRVVRHRDQREIPHRRLAPRRLSPAASSAGGDWRACIGPPTCAWCRRCTTA